MRKGKRNFLIVGIIGVLIGAGCYAGIDAIFFSNKDSQASAHGFGNFSGGKFAPFITHNNFDILKEDINGNCYISPHGKKYHKYLECSYLKKAHKTRKVSSENAKQAGLSPCSKCY